MKKLLKISLGAMFVVLPLAARAEVTEPTPYAGNNESSVTAGDTPKYALAQRNEDFDGTLATAGYVKGAYNATIKGINAVHDEVEGLDDTLEDYAKKEGVVLTIKDAQMSGSVDTTITGATVSDASYSGGSLESGAVTNNGTISAATVWGAETTGDITVSAELGSDVTLAATTVGGSANIDVSGTLQTGVIIDGYYATATTQNPETFNN